MALLRHPLEAAPQPASFPPHAGRAAAFPRIGSVGSAALGSHEAAFIRSLRPEALATWTATLGSGFVCLVLYAALWGGVIGCGLVLGMWIHELGHQRFAHRLGLAVSPIVFVPFVGAVQRLRSRPTRAVDGALLALAGPLCGLCFALGCKLAFALTHVGALSFLGSAHAFLALVDLCPVRPLDGGRVLAALRPLRISHHTLGIGGVYAVLVGVAVALIAG